MLYKSISSKSRIVKVDVISGAATKDPARGYRTHPLYMAVNIEHILSISTNITSSKITNSATMIG